MAEELLTLAAAKTHLRVQHDREDADITRRIASATGWVERHIETPIIDKDIAPEFDNLCLSEGMSFIVDIRSVNADTIRVKYWLPETHVAESPDGEVTPGRISFTEDGRVKLWPPATGWPDYSRAAPVIIQCSVGIPEDDIPQAWRDAALLVLSELYDGRTEISGVSYRAAKSLLQSWRRSI